MAAFGMISLRSRTAPSMPARNRARYATGPLWLRKDVTVPRNGGYKGLRTSPRCRGLRRDGTLAPQELSLPGLGRQLAFVDHDLTAREDERRPAADPHAFVGRVVAVVVQQIVGDRDVPVAVPDHEVGVRAHGDRALPRIEAVELRRIGRRERDEGREIGPALVAAPGEEDRQPGRGATPR